MKFVAQHWVACCVCGRAIRWGERLDKVNNFRQISIVCKLKKGSKTSAGISSSK